jgi:DNA repair exonuclease SbcCD nuclease subunit
VKEHLTAADYPVVAGDVYDTRQPNSGDVWNFSRFVPRLSGPFAGCPFVEGQHDRSRRGGVEAPARAS